MNLFLQGFIGGVCFSGISGAVVCWILGPSDNNAAEVEKWKSEHELGVSDLAVVRRELDTARRVLAVVRRELDTARRDLETEAAVIADLQKKLSSSRDDAAELRKVSFFIRCFMFFSHYR